MDGGILILKSSNYQGEVFFIWGGWQVHIVGTVIMVTKMGHNSGQSNYTITFFSRKPGKVTFMVTFKEKIVVIFASLVLKGCDL